MKKNLTFLRFGLAMKGCFARDAGQQAFGWIAALSWSLSMLQAGQLITKRGRQTSATEVKRHRQNLENEHSRSLKSCGTMQMYGNSWATLISSNACPTTKELQSLRNQYFSKGYKFLVPRKSCTLQVHLEPCFFWI